MLVICRYMGVCYIYINASKGKPTKMPIDTPTAAQPQKKAKQMLKREANALLAALTVARRSSSSNSSSGSSSSGSGRATPGVCAGGSVVALPINRYLCASVYVQLVSKAQFPFLLSF